MAGEKEKEKEKDRRDPEHLPALTRPKAWGKAVAFLAILIAVNVVAALVSFGLGIIAVLPITVFLVFLLGRELIPRHWWPSGRRPPPAAGPV